ncbi:MAG: XdhC family protein [Rhodobacteraceae bacterium]|nr:XdhC family protein [Paracoccaceae bacterium]
MSDPHPAFDPNQIPETAMAWLDAGKGAALATVTQTWGSAPRPVGAQLAVSSEAELAGSVSGGCVEGAVTAEALEAIGDGRPRMLEYGVSDDEAFAVGLACGGTIKVLVEPIGVGDGPSRAEIEALAAARAARRAVGYLVDVQDWSRRLIDPEEAPDAFSADRSGFQDEEARRFLAVHNPPLRMMVIGAVHIAQALAPMARLAGYDVTLNDPREAFASENRFPGHTLGEDLTHDWPDAALERFAPNARSAIVCLSHDPKIDDPALIRALASPAFYVGALGSTRTHAKRVGRLTQAGLSGAQIARLHAPIGLPLGARSPAEIAISVLAEITERLRKPETRK